MTVWGLLAPKGWALVATLLGPLAVLFGSIHFENTVTVGTVFVAGLVIVLSGVFTLRSNIRSYWKGLAEERAAKITSLEQDVKDSAEKLADEQAHSRAQMAKTAAEERAIRHDLKNEKAALTAQLQIEQAKTDLSALLELLSTQHSESMLKIAEGLEKQQEIIGLLTVTRDFHQGTA